MTNTDTSFNKWNEVHLASSTLQAINMHTGPIIKGNAQVDVIAKLKKETQ